jgi:uncharacterized protein
LTDHQGNPILDIEEMSLQYNVSSLLKEPVGSTRNHPIDDRVLFDAEGRGTSQITGEVSFLRTPRGVLVSAKLGGTYSDACSRCLKEVRQPLDVSIEEEFVQSFDLHTGARVDQESDPDDFRIDKHHMLDLEDAVRQYWSAGLPMRALCRTECAGLCPRCGVDLNDGPHACEPEGDERWSALKQIAANLERS